MELSEWVGGVVEPGGAGTPPAPEEWHPVELPGSPPRFAGEDCVAYRTTFGDPREGEATRALLTLRGAYARSRVWINGELRRSHDVYFAPARFVFEPEPDNEVVVECRPPDDRFGGVHESDQVPPAASVPAVWWGATVEGLPPVGLVGLRAEPRPEAGAFDVELRADAARAVDDTVTFSVRPRGHRGGGTMQRASLSAQAGARTTLETTLEARDPQRWYPRGHGPQSRYEVAARYAGREVTVETGLRTVEHGEDGFRVNGRRVPLRGFDVLPRVEPSAEPAADVERAVEANATLLRAHAHVPPPAFRRACDEAGVVLWQDLPLTGPGGYDIDRGRELARTLARQVGHHPSLGAFAVHDDPRDLFPSPIGGGRLGRLRLRWRARRREYNAEPDEAVAGAFPEEVPTFPVVGPIGLDPDATCLYPGWDYGRAGDVEWLLGRDPGHGRVVAEFGAGALAGAAGEGSDPDGHAGPEVGEGPAAGFDRAKHDAHVGGGVEASQGYQAAVLKTVAEALRRHGTHAAAAFALRDTGAAGMGALARDGTEKRGFRAIGASFEPLQVVLDGPPRGTVGTTVLNDTHETVEGTVSWSAGDRDGEAGFAVGALERADGPTVAVPDGAAIVELELEAGDRTVENRYRPGNR